MSKVNLNEINSTLQGAIEIIINQPKDRFLIQEIFDTIASSLKATIQNDNVIVDNKASDVYNGVPNLIILIRGENLDRNKGILRILDGLGLLTDVTTNHNREKNEQEFLLRNIGKNNLLVSLDAVLETIEFYANNPSLKLNEINVKPIFKPETTQRT